MHFMGAFLLQLDADGGILCGGVQSPSLTNNQVLATDLPGQSLTVFLKGPGVVISGVQTAANVTQPNIIADRVCCLLLPRCLVFCLSLSSKGLRRSRLPMLLDLASHGDATQGLENGPCDTPFRMGLSSECYANCLLCRAERLQQ